MITRKYANLQGLHLGSSDEKLENYIARAASKSARLRKTLNTRTNIHIVSALRNRDYYVPMIEQVGQGPLETLIAMLFSCGATVDDHNTITLRPTVIADVAHLTSCRGITEATLRKHLNVLDDNDLISWAGLYKASDRHQRRRRCKINFPRIEQITGWSMPCPNTQPALCKLAVALTAAEQAIGMIPRTKGGKVTLTGANLALFKYLRGADGVVLSYREISDALTIGYFTVRKAVRYLLKNGYLDRVCGGEGRSDKSAYRTLKHVKVTMHEKVAALRRYLEFKGGTGFDSPIKRIQSYFIKRGQSQNTQVLSEPTMRSHQAFRPDLHPATQPIQSTSPAKKADIIHLAGEILKQKMITNGDKQMHSNAKKPKKPYTPWLENMTKRRTKTQHYRICRMRAKQLYDVIRAHQNTPLNLKQIAAKLDRANIRVVRKTLAHSVRWKHIERVEIFPDGAVAYITPIPFNMPTAETDAEVPPPPPVPADAIHPPRTQMPKTKRQREADRAARIAAEQSEAQAEVARQRLYEGRRQSTLKLGSMKAEQAA